MKIEKKKRILFQLILLAVLTVPLFFILNGRQMYVWYESLLYSLLTVVGCCTVAILCGFLLVLAIYGCGRLFLMYINSNPNQQGEKQADEFGKGWILEKVMDRCYPVTTILVFALFYVLSLIG